MAAKKLNSRRGASFLLALLFFLICALVSSMVLMAAASSAGRTRGSLEEHQRYLTLSSAVRTLCGELADAEYRGAYAYRTESRDTGEVDADGNPIMTEVTILTQTDGTYTGALEKTLRPVFDSIFAQKFTSGLADEVYYKRPVFSTDRSFRLTVTPNSGEAALDGQPVEVELTVQESYAMVLIARLGEDYAIQAELTPTASLPAVDNLYGDIHKSSPMGWRVSAILPGDTWGEGADGNG